jgi:hypothetical protein
LWRNLTAEQVFRVDAWTLARSAIGWALRLTSGGSKGAPRVRGFLDTQPLRELLDEVLAPVNGEITGIDYNLARGKLKAVAIITTSYTTGQTVVYLKGNAIEPWEAAAATHARRPDHGGHDHGVGRTADVLPGRADRQRVVRRWRHPSGRPALAGAAPGRQPPARHLDALRPHRGGV